jgi:hypothetical protein
LISKSDRQQTGTFETLSLESDFFQNSEKSDGTQYHAMTIFKRDFKSQIKIIKKWFFNQIQNPKKRFLKCFFGNIFPLWYSFCFVTYMVRYNAKLSPYLSPEGSTFYVMPLLGVR